MNLRPIGTKFIQEVPPSLWTTNSCGSRVYCEVIKHVKVQKSQFCPTGEAEEIKILKVEDIDVREYNILMAGQGSRYIKKTDPLPIIEIIDNRDEAMEGR